ncbi:hypothetical protein LTSEURB_6284 [Salmonella enterica subsp. enterica serovar Urbana str. R8-2977]|uniref:Fimbrial protein n=1 Tax=Salmonella enterica subsp. enterica serovar Urbana str. R8-2977 TaxID=913084 RepID=G5S4B4_SALET|nr:hypothetical protein LTSEURB_6284 [Salmonella enterica subsp. enterica serovar Urbana str. R8-2977]
MKKIKILFLLLLAGGGLSHASVQKTLFSADVVASACHVVVDADGTGSMWWWMLTVPTVPAAAV